MIRISADKAVLALAIAPAFTIAGPAFGQAGPAAKRRAGAVNINAANVAQLQALGFAQPAAQNIVAWVQANGPIQNVAQLNAIAGVNANLVNTLQAAHRLAIDTAGDLLGTAGNVTGVVVA